MNKSLLAVLVLGLIGLGVYMRKPKLDYFTPSEFGAWYPLMNNELLRRLDLFRKILGSAVYISPVNGALGRHGGNDDHSQHNVDLWGTVNAIDVFPTIDGEYITTQEQRNIVYLAALEAGFTGIGLYTDTAPANMLHVDVRNTSEVALWSRVNGNYLGINEVLA